MVTRKNIEKKYALISVYNKNNLYYLCNNLKKYNYSFISTGSTCARIKKIGFRCIEVKKITSSKEILDGRVKTLDSKLYASILHLRDNIRHLKEFTDLQVPRIDLVVVNLYPFSDFIKNNSNEKNIIEMIDIGGPSLIRASSKNFKYLTTISSIVDYKDLVDNLKKNNGVTNINFRKRMAAKAFEITSKYDQDISVWFSKKIKEKTTKLRYGENPNQKATILNNSNSIFKYQLNGKNISYNNIIDVDSGYNCLREFSDPTCVVVKHTNPCGVASAKNITNAFDKAINCDEKSSFGGIVLLNRKIDIKLANKISKKFYEVIVSPKFEKTALKLLKNKKNLILLEIKSLNKVNNNFRSTIFGKLNQNTDTTLINKKFIKLASLRKSTKNSIEDLIFSIKVIKHLKSNAIVLSKNKQTVGIGVGQSNRNDALKNALKNMKLNFGKIRFVCASDGFFPFTDSLSLLKKNDCVSIAQPSGSINDKKIINYVNKYNISLYLIKNRLFKH